MSAFCYYNGALGPFESIKIPLSDRSAFFGDGVYDMAVGRNGKIHRIDEHIERFFRSCRGIEIGDFISYDSLYDILDLTVKKAGLSEYSVYFQATRNAPRRIHSHLCSSGTNLLVVVDEFTLCRELTKIKLITLEDLRYNYCNLKTINLLPAVLASAEAERHGCDEVVFVRGGRVTECAHSNISILSRGALYTHPDCELVLPGITKKHLLSAARKLGICVKEIPFGVGELVGADEILVTSTTRLLRVASEINGVRVGGRAEDLALALHKALVDEYLSEMEK